MSLDNVIKSIKPRAKNMKLNVIHHEDCIEGMRKLPDACVDMVVTSPPYDGMRIFKGSFDFESTAVELCRVLKDGGVIFWNVWDQVIKGGYSLTSFRQALYFTDELGLKMYEPLIWDKGFTGFDDGRTRHRTVYEYLFVFSKGKPKRLNILKDRPNKSAGKLQRGVAQRQPDGTKRLRSEYVTKPYGSSNSIWKIHHEHGSAIDHVAKFPVELVVRAIRTYSREGDVVLDPFMGSGTTAVACKKWQRAFIGYEIDEKYWRSSLKRVG